MREIKEIDPYRQLALYMVSHLPQQMVKHCMEDEDAILGYVKNECRDLDYHGPFLDAIIADNHTLEGSIWVHQQQDALARGFFSRLDVERLRSCITQIVEDL